MSRKEIIMKRRKGSFAHLSHSFYIFYLSCFSFSTEKIPVFPTLEKSYFQNDILEWIDRSSRPEVFCKKGVLRKSCLRPATLLKKSLWHRCFSADFAKFLRTPFLQITSGGCFWKDLNSSSTTPWVIPLS